MKRIWGKYPDIPTAIYNCLHNSSLTNWHVSMTSRLHPDWIPPCLSAKNRHNSIDFFITIAEWYVFSHTYCIMSNLTFILAFAKNGMWSGCWNKIPTTYHAVLQVITKQNRDVGIFYSNSSSLLLNIQIIIQNRLSNLDNLLKIAKKGFTFCQTVRQTRFWKAKFS